MKIKRTTMILTMLLFSAHLSSAAGLRNLSALESRNLLEKKDGVFLLDVRTPDEYRQVRIEGARLIPIEQLLGRLSEVPRDRPILVYCAVGSRSARVADYLARQGFSEVYNLFGGIWGWQLRGLPVLKGGP